MPHHGPHLKCVPPTVNTTSASPVDEDWDEDFDTPPPSTKPDQKVKKKDGDGDGDGPESKEITTADVDDFAEETRKVENQLAGLIFTPDHLGPKGGHPHIITR